MKELIPKDDYGVYADMQETARVTSLDVARIFNKQHKNVIRDIEMLDCSAEFSRLNFEPSKYKDERGKWQPCVAMTRDGFTFLVMGYRGKTAARFKEAYIARFNQMQRHIAELIDARREFPELTDAISFAYVEPKAYHFINECNMINVIVTGICTAEFRQRHGIEKGQSIRPHMTTQQIALLNALQRVDIGLLVSVPEYADRKRYLEKYATRKLAGITA